MSYKKDFRKLKDTTLYGAAALQATPMLTNRSIGGLTNTAAGMVGVGIAGATTNAVWNIMEGKKKRRRR